MRHGIYIALAAGATIYVGICVAMFLLQRSLMYYPQPRSVTAAGSILLLSVPGAELTVTVRPHAGSKALIYFGGNAEDVSASLASFSQAFPDYALFLLHYRGYGGSTGHPSERANGSDALALFRQVFAQHADVAVIGRSLGSAVAIRLASEAPVSRLVLVTPFNSIEQIAAAEYPYVPVRWLLRDRYESWKYAPAVKVPTTIIAARNDATIPRASTEELLTRFHPGVASMAVIDGVGHNDIATKSEYLRAIQAALQ